MNEIVDPDISQNGRKCDACGHATASHNELGYCRHATMHPSMCSGSCNWHPRDGHDSLARAREWDESDGAGKVKRRAIERGLTFTEYYGYFRVGAS